MTDAIVEIALLAIGMGVGWAITHIENEIWTRRRIRSLVEKELVRATQSVHIYPK